MEIQLTKEKRLNGAIFYCIYVDGKYVSSHSDEVRATEEYNNVIKNGGEEIEVIKTTTI